MYPALQALKKSGKYILAALSNTVIFPETHPFSNPPAEKDIRRVFDVFVSSAHIGLRKPDPRIYAHALQAVNTYALSHASSPRGKALNWSAGIQASDVVFSDDIGENLKAGKAFGFRTIKVHLGRAYEAVDELESITGLELAGGQPRVPITPVIRRPGSGAAKL
ncbi:hypothetical protein IFR05_001586 [Cadophora sp. M221]|nr:hypothetical protein IFR05_001586 [Cadophora sp. M221]